MANIRHTSESEAIIQKYKNRFIVENAFLITRNPIQINWDLLRNPVQVASESEAGKTTFCSGIRAML